MRSFPQPFGLYDPGREHDSCGVGAVVDLRGRRDHHIVECGRRILENLMHRGAAVDDSTGDGAGILIQIPDEFFRDEFKKQGVALPAFGAYGVAMLFASPAVAGVQTARDILTEAAQRYGLRILGWREVPAETQHVGGAARRSAPIVLQAVLAGEKMTGEELERRLFLARRRAERLARECDSAETAEFYISSMSARTLVYKGMFVAQQLSAYYPDLRDKRLTTSLAIVHQRYSTNTFPSWRLAQPFRMLAHNGEINTLRGNVNRMRSRERRMACELFGDALEDVLPVIDASGSDSACLDNVLELLVRAGRSLPHAMMMLVPEAFGAEYHISADKRAFYEYHSAIMEPWDGPAALVVTDGRYVGGMLDRNGLRPGRYLVTTDGLVVLASEAGALEIPPARVQHKGRLQPGRMFLVDLAQHRIVSDNEIKSRVARRKPYRRWVEQNQIELRGLFGASKTVHSDAETIAQRLRLFGYTREELNVILAPMARDAQEPIGSMGTDTPLAALSQRPRLLFDYFKQQFAQVTNPAIDPLREGLVMSLMAFAGRDRNLLEETPEHCRQLKLAHPILTNEDIERLRGNTRHGLRAATLPALFPVQTDDPGAAMQLALDALGEAAAKAIDDGAALLILSDRGADANHAPLPSLLATAAVHHDLIERGLRDEVGLIVESGEPREVMHFCLLCGYGASAVNPYLAFEALDEIERRGELPGQREEGEHIEHYITAIKKGLLKTMSKMGISTLRSYRGAQLFEALGLNRSLVERYFPATPTRIQGADLGVVAQETQRRHQAAFAPRPPGLLPLDFGGEYAHRADGERHAWNPQSLHLLQHAVRQNDARLYEQYARQINADAERCGALRGLFRFKPGSSVPLEEVEPASEIVKRFCTGAMSHGSISKETHETLAAAMNRLGAASNTGEGGEDPARYKPSANGDSLNSAIKQVASARFGVTIEYLSQARELQIKVAQGAKPGEGGQLPGFKVTPEIARLRHSIPGVTLISPPPHHDIYSIEDLAQLIYDLKCANPGVEVSVKLVAEVGVGAVAVGVAKANADEVLISGYDGGTGASPLSSIKHAGVPWEIGLAETQQTLLLNGLRSRIRVQADGGMRTGRDIIVAALLGAERFGVGTAALIAVGCILMRKCHLGTCPVGVATQDPVLRARFKGKPEHIERLMLFLAEDVRRRMAELGYRRFDEMVGHSERLDFTPAVEHWKAHRLDLSPLLARPDVPEDAPRRRVTRPPDPTTDALDRGLLPKVERAITDGRHVRVEMPIRNIHRTVGALLSNRIVRARGAAGLPDDTIECIFTGSAGQSFGAFLAPGLLLRLIGDANDYVAKGLSGGRVIIQTPEESPFEAHENVIAGNTILYGATKGEVLINGVVGERFAVRNSGAVAVVEGVGDHGCEYMTGGVVVVLGRTGRNFAAGMSGGVAYVLDEHQLFDTLCNLDMVELETVWHEDDQRQLWSLIDRHRRWTGSRQARRILDDWREMVGKFVKVTPIDYREALKRQRDQESAGDDFSPATEEVFRA